MYDVVRCVDPLIRLWQKLYTEPILLTFFKEPVHGPECIHEKLFVEFLNLTPILT